MQTSFFLLTKTYISMKTIGEEDYLFKILGPGSSTSLLLVVSWERVVTSPTAYIVNKFNSHNMSYVYKLNNLPGSFLGKSSLLRTHC